MYECEDALPLCMCTHARERQFLSPFIVLGLTALRQSLIISGRLVGQPAPGMHLSLPLSGRVTGMYSLLLVPGIQTQFLTLAKKTLLG